jgi:hypothetical protein
LFATGEKNMSIHFVIEMQREQTAQSVMRALDSYKARLRNSVERTQRRLANFETLYQVTTAHFLKKMTAEDLAGGDLEYVEWAGEAKLLAGLEDELGELEHAHYQLPWYTKAVTALIDTLLASGQARLVNLQVDQRSMLRGLISGILAFENDSELHFSEFLDLTQSEPRLMYAYHYQDSKKTLVFRYDNAAHRSPLPLTKHKHTASTVSPAPAPTFMQVIDEIFEAGW